MAEKKKKRQKASSKKGWKLSAAAKSGALEAFTMFASDESGLLNAGQLRLSLQALGVEVDEETAESMLERVDGDGDGLLKEEEFLALCEEERIGAGGGDNSKDISLAFSLFDAEGRGFITKEDLKRVARDLGENFTSEELDEVSVFFLDSPVVCLFFLRSTNLFTYTR